MANVTSEMVGRKVVTDMGEATVVRVITSKQWLHVKYPDGSIGWVGEGQFKLL